MSDKEVDELSGTETTGHEWDGIKELNTPLPRWWLWTFYGTIVWALIYVVLFPAIPMLNGATKGLLGYSSRAELTQTLDKVNADQAVIVQQISTMDISEVAANPDLARFARAAGGSLFKVYCSQCHGSGAQGGPGYPNLNDDEWIWGGTLEDIMTTIAHGVRADDEDTRFNQMPAFGDGILSTSEIDQVAGYVLSLSNTESDLPASAEGRTLFEDNCAACHGAAGEGVPELGGPPLNNAIWLFNDTPEAIVAQISNPKHGVMPAWQAKLGVAAVKDLAIYVHSLGGGQ